MTNIFVVIGMTGEYSDRREWVVKAFYDVNIAQDFILKLEERARLIQIKERQMEDEGEVWYEESEIIEKYFPEMKDMDSNFQMSYNGTHYHFEECVLE